jgi:hypothetical protein
MNYNQLSWKIDKSKNRYQACINNFLVLDSADILCIQYLQKYQNPLNILRELHWPEYWVEEIQIELWNKIKYQSGYTKEESGKFYYNLINFQTGRINLSNFDLLNKFLNKIKNQSI